MKSDLKCPQLLNNIRWSRLVTNMHESKYRVLTQFSERQIQELYTLYQGEWWTRGRRVGDITTMLEHSNFVFALSDVSDDRLVAFARVLTDMVFKAFIFDLIVAPDRRDEGLGRRLIENILHHPDIKKVKHIELYCLPELVPFYEKLGFSTDVSGVSLMRRKAD
jgi:GNAT superfamily N-acetyltransferase